MVDLEAVVGLDAAEKRDDVCLRQIHDRVASLADEVVMVVGDSAQEVATLISREYDMGHQAYFLESLEGAKDGCSTDGRISVHRTFEDFARR